MRVTRTSVVRVCAICERSLLMGERVTRFSPNGDGQLVDVCPLCTEIAVDHGWVKEGSPTTPVVPDRRRRRKAGIGRWLEDLRRPSAPEPVLAEPILRRLSDDELALVDAADLFNASDYRRTVGGIAKSLGSPRASIVQLAGVNAELVITVAWDISWYQYRVTPDAPQPVRLEQRGHDLAELGHQYQAWNAHLEDDGRVVPEIERL
ncbi:MAG: hypothetical protein ACJ75P_02680 [Gaiellaceae bacterium]